MKFSNAASTVTSSFYIQKHFIKGKVLMKYSKEFSFVKCLSILTMGAMSFILIGFSILSAQTTITVNTGNVIASGVSTKYGINVNVGRDDDANRVTGARTLATALREMGAKHIRWPGGGKSNDYFFAKSPYTDPSTGYWCNSVDGVWIASATRTQSNLLNLDEFMALCSSVGAEPHVNVAYNPSYGLNETVAAAEVRYANITKKYGIKYWEIGNEMWKSEKGLSISALATIASNYSKAMKAVDPTIQIGVSWTGGTLQSLINACGSSIDFVTYSNYMGGDYSLYSNSLNFNLLNLSGTSKPVVASEYSAWRFGSTGFDGGNNTGKGLMQFDMTGQLLKNTNVLYGCFWNTRYILNGSPNTTANYNPCDAVDYLNNLYPQTKSLALWSKFIKDKLVSISGTSSIVTYAAYDDNTKALSLFLINKSTSPQSVNVNITSANAYSSPAQIWQYKGNSITDQSPTLGNTGTATVSANKMTGVTLPMLSVTALVLGGSGSSNSFPIFTSLDTITTRAGVTTKWVAKSTDADGNAVSYTYTSLPAGSIPTWMVVSTNTAKDTLKITPLTTSPILDTIRVIANDGSGGLDTLNLKIRFIQAATSIGMGSMSPNTMSLKINGATIAFHANCAKQINVSVFTLNGALVANWNIDNSNNTHSVSSGTIKSGLYMVKAKSGTEISTQKLFLGNK